MALNNDQDANALNIHNLDSRYKQYSQTLNELRDPNNLSFTNSNITNGVESVNTNSLIPSVQQGPDLKEQLLNIITSNTQPDNLKQVTFNNVQTTTFVDDIDEFPLDDVKVTCQPMPPLQTLTTNISKTNILDQKPFDRDFNFIDEGHFHRETPQAKRDNLKRIRNRLLIDSKDSYFFDITGELKNDAPTLRHVPPSFLNDPCSRAPFDSDESSLHYTPASEWTIENSNIARHVRVEISKIRFISHELSSDQDLLTNQLQLLYDSCMNDIKFPKTEYFVQKIQALREELKHRPDREKDILKEIVESHESRDLEEKKMCEKRNSLLECWHMLKEAREKSKPTTKISLCWKAKKFNEEERNKEEALFDQDIKQRAIEKHKYSLLTNDEDIKEVDEIINDLKENHSQMGLRMPGETKWIPILKESEKAEFKELSSQEQNRINRIAKTRISVGFYMGIYEVLSDDAVLFPDFISEPNVGCHAIALHAPPSIKVHIFQSGISKRHEIATVILPVFKGEQPEFKEYEFSSPEPLSNGRMIQGFIEARCFVQTDSDSLETMVKDTRSEYIRKENVVDKVKKRPILMTNKLMSELVSKHDPNDPYLTAAIATMKAHRLNETEERKFTLDTHSDQTLFASMAASDIWKQIPNRAYDLIRPTAENPILYNSEEEGLKLYDVITQPPRFTFSSFFKSFFGFFKRNKKNREVSLQGNNYSHRIEERSAILLHIHQISFVPQRYSGQGSFSNAIEPADKEVTTQPKEKVAKKSNKSNVLVRISLQGVEHASAIVHGNPDDFNKQVELRLVKEGESVPDFNQIEEKTIRLDIFDEYSPEELQFIGTLQIPLRSIFINGDISGTFSITSPHFTMDHTIPEMLSKLTLSICLKPKLIYERSHLPCPVAESNEVNDKAHNLWNILRNDFPKRNYSILVMTTEEKSMLPCRMLTQQTINEISSIEEILTFVSMIPTNSTIEKKDKTAWSTSDRIIENNTGTNIEHALLFCNILLGQNINAYVILGNDMISGYDAYVLVIQDERGAEEMDDYLRSSEDATKTKRKKMKNRSQEVIGKDRLILYNPTNGKVFNIDNSDITLFDVSTVFNNKNVWFNIQEHGIPLSEMNWNFYNKDSWTPFFDLDFRYIEFKSPQPSELEILKSNQDRIRKIEKKVKQIIEETVESFRPQTKWFLSIKQNLKDILIARKEIEPENEHSIKKFDELIKETTQKFNNYRIVGSPFFISYVYDGNANDGILRNEIYDEIKKREICSCYLSEDGKEETQETYYSRAVEIKAFPNEIYAIWVLLVAIHPKNPKETPSRIESKQQSPTDQKKKNEEKNNDSEYYSYEEEEEYSESKEDVKGKIIIHSDDADNEEDHNDSDSRFVQDKSKSPKSNHSSPDSSTKKHISHSNSPISTPRNKSDQNSTPKRKSEHNTPNSSSKSIHSSPNSTKKSGQSSPRSSIKDNEKKEEIDDEIIEEEEEVDSDSDKPKSPSSAIETVIITKTEEIRKETHERIKKVKKGADDGQSKKDNDNSDSEKSSYSSDNKVTLDKVLMLGERLENKDNENDGTITNKNENNEVNNDKNKGEEIKGSKKATTTSQNNNDDDNNNDDYTKSKKESKSNRNISSENEEEVKTSRSSRSGKSTKKANISASNSKTSKVTDSLVKRRKDEDSDSDNNNRNNTIKKSRSKKGNDDEGEIYVITDISPSARSSSINEYKDMLKDPRKRRRHFENSSDEDDENNDSVYQIKKKSKKINTYESDYQAKMKRKQPTRRRVRDDDEDQKENSSPVKNLKKRLSKSKSKVDKSDEEHENEKKLSPILLESDSEN